MPWSRNLACGYWIQGDALEVDAGSPASLGIQGALDEASHILEDTGRRLPVRLLAEEYLFDRTVRLPSRALIEIAPGASLRAADDWAADASLADDPTNALFAAASTISGAAETTLAVAAFEGQSAITTAAPLVGAEGEWFALVSTSAQTGYPGMSFGADVVRAEFFRVLSVVGTAATLDRELAQTRGAGSSLYRVTDLVEGVAIYGGGDLALEGVQTGGAVACGVYLSGVPGVEIEIGGAGASRALVELAWCRGITARVRNRGQNCAPFLSESSHEGRLELDWDAASSLAVASDLGIPRGVAFHDQSMRWLVTGQIGNCVGVEFKGLSSSRWAADLARCDFAARSARDPNLFVGMGGNKVGAVLMNCSNPASSESEVPVGLTMAAKLTDCVVPDPSGLLLEHAVLFVDSVATVADRLHIVNTGSDPTAAGAKKHGVMFYDTSAFSSPGVRIRDLETRGVQSAICLYGGGNSVVIDEWGYAPSAASGAGTIAICYGHSAAVTSPVWIGRAVFAEPPLHLMADHPGSAGVNHASLGDVRVGRLEVLSTAEAHDLVSWCLDVGGLADFGGAQGDVLEVRPPIAVALASATDTFTSAGHDLPDGAAGYLRATALPGGYAAGQIVYVRDSNRSGANTTFKVAATLGGVAFNFSSDGTAVEFQTTVQSVYSPTTLATGDKGTRVNGSGFGAGLALPVRYYAVAYGEEGVMRVAAGVWLPGDRGVPTVGALTATLDNASADPLRVSRGKPGAAAGIVRGFRR